MNNLVSILIPTFWIFPPHFQKQPIIDVKAITFPKNFVVNAEQFNIPNPPRFHC